MGLRAGLFNYKMRYLFISPHADDIALSCAGLVQQLHSKGHHCSILNIFNGFYPWDTLDSKVLIMYMKEDMGIPETQITSCACEKFVQARNREDMKAQKMMGCAGGALNLPDAIFRRDGNHFFYPTEEALFACPHLSDHIEAEVLEQLEKIKSLYDIFVFPLGVGNHVDHFITHNIGLTWMRERDVLFYYEYPYFAEDAIIKTNQYSVYVNIEEQHLHKIRAIEQYQTQLAGLFGSVELSRVVPAYEIYTGIEKEIKKYLG